MTNVYDQFLRRTNLTLNSQPSTLHHRYTYGQASRLDTVSDGTDAATYSYLANSMLVSNIVFQHSGTPRATTFKQHDFMNRLTSITNQPTGAAAIGYQYVYNDANQRSSVTNADGSWWVYTYDKLGQVTSGKKYWSDGTLVAGQQFEYGFDDIGNRKTNRFGGNASGSNLQLGTNIINALNQYVSRDVPGAVEIIGAADASATVSVNDQPTYRKSGYYWKELTFNNSGAAVYPTVNVLGVKPVAGNPSLVANSAGHVFVPKRREEFGYDADGNLTSDGRWNYTWDGENRLVRLVANTAVGPQQRIDFEYDGKGRRIAKKVWENTSGSGTPALHRKFVYDGWNLLAELDPSHSAVRTYLWGLDLSGTMQGAGGVGGLFAVSDTANGTHFACYDGNGNVTALVKASDGTVSANYEYGPFGELLRTTGLMAKANPFRFSTKYEDDESDLLYYGYRSYNPVQGRWLSRDPLGDEAFRLSLARDFDLPLEEGNLHAFVQNNPVSRTDLLGLFSKFEDCDCCQVEALKKDEAVAQAHIEGLKKSIQAVLPAILADPQKYPYRTAFKFNTALTKLAKASKKLKSATVKCEKSSGPIASAFPWGNTVKVYEAYWHYTDFGQGAHLVHEGTHMGSGTTDATYFWQNQRDPLDTFFIPWNEIASTYDSWIINGFCIPGYDCPKGTLPPATHIRRSSKECP